MAKGGENDKTNGEGKKDDGKKRMATEHAKWRPIAAKAVVVLAVILAGWTVRGCMQDDFPGIGNDAMWEIYVRGVKSDNEALIVSSLTSLAGVESRRAEAIPLARTKLNDDRPHVKGAAAVALGMLGDAESTPAILKMLDSEKFAIQAGACRALGFLGEKAALEPLLLLIESQDANVRVGAIEGLGRLGDAKAVKPIEALRAAPLNGLYAVPTEALETRVRNAIDEALTRLKGGGSAAGE